MKDKNAYKLLEILQSHALTGVEQQLCLNLYNDITKGGANGEREMAIMLTDGLLYGNWPWVKIEDKIRCIR